MNAVEVWCSTKFIFIHSYRFSIVYVDARKVHKSHEKEKVSGRKVSAWIANMQFVSIPNRTSIMNLLAFIQRRKSRQRKRVGWVNFKVLTKEEIDIKFM